MKIFLKIILLFILVSCSLRDIKTSKYARINDQDQYENNYIRYDKKSTKLTKFFSFFLKNIFDPPDKKKFEIMDINKQIYKKEKSLLTWAGHSTFLFQKENVNILIDPQFSLRASPFSSIGPRRYIPSIFNEDNLPRIDIVAISHNHYDHLDIRSLKIIYEKNPNVFFLVPLGDKKLLIQNGIKNVKEFDWWEDYKIGGINLTFTPVQHWSKRTFFDKNKSLWGGWWIKSNNFKFLHLGDTGYTKDFLDIKKRLGKPDLVAIPIGAYKPRDIMKYNHINPEEAVKTLIDLEAKKAVAMHWGTFILSQEAVDEPVNEVKKNLKIFGINEERFLILKHGETIKLN
jgi:L-ascorbate metabolism protein UlaG (beta-lactamase superfamily)|tara:strand:+ start:6321 stop:7349 length:1029 start_codon:yes stop_codon:yes gene_type:complete